MPITQQIKVAELFLDLKNFRTTPQTDEVSAIHAMIAVNPNRFHAIIESLIEDEYIPTENIICQQISNKLIVKEGNRRIGAMKIILGLHDLEKFEIPDSIKTKISLLDHDWKERNSDVPCSIYNENETEKVDRIVSLTHGKGDKASRDPWTSVARARHNRDVNKAKEDGLNLLEKYIQVGRNLNAQQKERWAGNYGVTVLDEALRKIYLCFGKSSVTELVNSYPKISDREKLEDILLSIGLEDLSFKEIRNENIDFAERFGLVSSKLSNGKITPNSKEQNSEIENIATLKIKLDSNKETTSKLNSVKPTISLVSGQSIAVSTNTQKHVNNLLKKFSPRGNRSKVVTLRNEMQQLKIEDNPIAFCFLLRSMFEISAKAYSEDHKLPTTKNGKEKTLKELLNQCTNHLTSNNANNSMVKVLHGALTEIANPDRILSVTSMNQLVHSPTFSIQQADICTLFNNIYPLLEALN